MSTDLFDQDAPQMATHRRVRRRRRLGRWFAPLLFVLPPLLVFGGAALWFRWQIDPPGEPGAVVRFTVEEGWSTARIADELDRAGVIGSSLAFQVYMRTGDHGTFRAGTYELRRNQGVRDAVEALGGGPAASALDVRVLRGLRVEQVADQIAAQVPGVSAAEFLEVVRSGAVRSRYQPESVTSLEGFLMPGRYELDREVGPRGVVRALVRRFDRAADAAGLGRAQGRSAYETLVLASLLEKEAILDEERPLIASVIENRLADGTRLQIDATVLYAVGKDGGFTTSTDRAVDSPYNTYRVTGLPPAPISNVSDASLRAALAPADTDYRFYVLRDRAGHHAFARTYEEHQANVEAARRKGLFG